MIWSRWLVTLKVFFDVGSSFFVIINFGLLVSLALKGRSVWLVGLAIAAFFVGVTVWGWVLVRFLRFSEFYGNYSVGQAPQFVKLLAQQEEILRLLKDKEVVV